MKQMLLRWWFLWLMMPYATQIVVEAVVLMVFVPSLTRLRKTGYLLASFYLYFIPINWLYYIGILHNYACFIWDFMLGWVFCCFCAFQVIFVETDHKPSTFGTYNTHLTSKAKVIKALMTQVKETRPKGAKVDLSKPTRPKLGRAKLART